MQRYSEHLQHPLQARAEGEWWHDIEEVFHTD